VCDGGRLGATWRHVDSRRLFEMYATAISINHTARIVRCRRDTGAVGETATHSLNQPSRAARRPRRTRTAGLPRQRSPSRMEEPLYSTRIGASFLSMRGGRGGRPAGWERRDAERRRARWTRRVIGARASGRPAAPCVSLRRSRLSERVGDGGLSAPAYIKCGPQQATEMPLQLR
jgi:hypothetical protein